MLRTGSAALMSSTCSTMPLCDGSICTSAVLPLRETICAGAEADVGGAFPGEVVDAAGVLVADVAEDQRVQPLLHRVAGGGVGPGLRVPWASRSRRRSRRRPGPTCRTARCWCRRRWRERGGLLEGVGEGPGGAVVGDGVEVHAHLRKRRLWTSACATPAAPARRSEQCLAGATGEVVASSRRERRRLEGDPAAPIDNRPFTSCTACDFPPPGHDNRPWTRNDRVRKKGLSPCAFHRHR